MSRVSVRRRTLVKAGIALPFASAALGGWLAALSPEVRAALAVRLGYQYHLWGAPAVVGLKKGFFQEQGVAVTDRRFSSGVDARNAMLSNSIDMGTVGVTPFIVGASRGEIAAIAAVCYAGRTAMVMARAGSGIQKVSDLRGKKIASQVGSTLDNVFKQRIAPEAGLTAKDYHIVNTKFQEQVSAVAAGSVDAMLNLEPFCSIAEDQKIATVLTDYYKYDLIPNLLVVNRPFLEKNMDSCVAFMRGWLKAVDTFNQNIGEAASIMLAVYREAGYQVSEVLTRRVLERLIVKPEFIPELPEYLHTQATILKESKRINVVPESSMILVSDVLTKARGK